MSDYPQWAYPSTLLLQKLPVSTYTSISVFLWGFLTLMCCITKNFAGFAVLRFLVGSQILDLHFLLSPEA